MLSLLLGVFGSASAQSCRTSRAERVSELGIVLLDAEQPAGGIAAEEPGELARRAQRQQEESQLMLGLRAWRRDAGGHRRDLGFAIRLHRFGTPAAWWC